MVLDKSEVKPAVFLMEDLVKVMKSVADEALLERALLIVRVTRDVFRNDYDGD